MKNGSAYKRLILAVLLSVPVLCASSQTEGAGAGAAGGGDAAVLKNEAWIIPIRGDIEPSMTAFVRRETKKAEKNNAAFIIYEIDTFGGRVDSALQITSVIMSVQNARTIAWIRNGGASMGVSWSAGALIALACRDIYMAEGTSIGAAAPVNIGADGTANAAGEKTVAAVRAQTAAIAEKNKHPVDIALAMVDFDVELWEAVIDGKSVLISADNLENSEKSGAKVQRVKELSPKGKLLALTSGEACRLGLARGTADEVSALISEIGAQSFVETESSAADQLISFLTSGAVQSILIIIGIVLLFIEFNTPGFGLAGTLSIMAFALVFGSGALLGRLESFEIIMFLLGLGALAAEIFLIPGFGVAGVSGIILIALSLVFSMQDFVIPTVDWEWDIFWRNIAVVSVGIVTSFTGIVLLMMLSPKLRLFNFLTLKSSITATASVYEGQDAELKGKTGVAVSTLRPSGKAEIDGQIYQVETDGVFLEAQTKIEVLKVHGSTIIVQIKNPS